MGEREACRKGTRVHVLERVKSAIPPWQEALDAVPLLVQQGFYRKAATGVLRKGTLEAIHLLDDVFLRVLHDIPFARIRVCLYHLMTIDTERDRHLEQVLRVVVLQQLVNLICCLYLRIIRACRSRLLLATGRFRLLA